MNTEHPDPRTASSLEENLKKALTELLVLYLLSEKERYIGELTELIRERSGGVLSIVFPYAAIYRMSNGEYITETKKRIAPDGRRRQYYQITEQGRAYLADLLETYQRFSGGVSNILSNGGQNETSSQ
jgi:PadR family transcriptional regulator PadR